MESLIVARPDIEYDLTLDNKKERFIFNSFEIKGESEKFVNSF